MARWIRFFIAILIGVGLGLLYGWLINPVAYVDTSPDTLSIDYKTDYVLMVAEAYHNDGDLAIAMRRIAMLGEPSPADMVYTAIIFAEKVGYTDADMALMQELFTGLQAYDLSVETPSP